MKKLFSLFIILCVVTSLFTVSVSAEEYGNSGVSIEDYNACRPDSVFINYLTELGVQNQVGIPVRQSTNFNYNLDKNDPYYIKLVNLTNTIIKDCSTDAEKVKAIAKFVYDQLINPKTHIYEDSDYDENGYVKYEYTCNHKDENGRPHHLYGTMAAIYESAGLCTKKPVTRTCEGCSYLTGYMLYLSGIPNIIARDCGHQYNLAYYDCNDGYGSGWYAVDGYNAWTGYSPGVYGKCLFYDFYMNGFSFTLYTDFGLKSQKMNVDTTKKGYINVTNYINPLDNKKKIVIPDFVDDVIHTAFWHGKISESYIFTSRMADGSEVLIKSKEVAQRIYDKTIAKKYEGDKIVKSPKTYTYKSNKYNYINVLTSACKPYFDGEYWVVRRHNLEFIEGTEKDCSHDATYRGYHCTLCDEYVTTQYASDSYGSYRYNIVLDKADGLTHNYGDWTVTEEATCSKKGIAEKTCSLCGNKITKDVPPNYEHNLSYLPAGTDNWIINRWYCPTCGKYWNADAYTKEQILTEACVSLSDNSEYFIKPEEPEKCEHDYQVVESKSKAATCTENGYTFYECTKCHDTKEETINATGHTFENYVYNNDASCNKDGTETAQCKNCNVKDIRIAKGTALKHQFSNYTTNKDADCTHNRTEIAHCDRAGCTATDEREVPDTALGHDFTYSNIIPATCVSPGKTGDLVCTRCGKTFSTGIETNPTGLHKFVYHEANEATCTKEGNVDYLQCSVCNKIFTLEGLPFVGTVVTPKLSHSTQLKNVVAATYFTTGYTGDKVCTDCGATISKGVVVKALKLKVPKYSFKGGKKRLSISYTNGTGATGFQVKYTIKGKNKVKNFNTLKSVKKTVKGLKKGKYKVQIRAFVKQNNKIAYSSWAKAKTVKVK